ncbi:MAG: hypothetical protein GXO06_04750 [Epsilonproteobacteria bacterium]|nr:hypothetical protein [Campylobacterota bacterium]
MKILQILIITAIFLSAELKLPTNFITEFNQTITNDKGKTIEYSGKLYFKQDINIYLDDLNSSREIRSRLFKWEYKRPTEKEVCSDGVELIVIDHELEQITRYLIDDGLDLERVLRVAKPITRRDYKATYRDIEYLITLDGEDRLERIFYVDSLDNRVKILFKGMKYNVLGFRSSHLECPAEPNYDVIEE